jgi:hypothetical protein
VRQLFVDGVGARANHSRNRISVPHTRNYRHDGR